MTRVATNPDGTIDVPALLARLWAAERVCVLKGRTASAGDTDADKAATQAWMEWNRTYRGLADDVSDAEVLRLAARRDVVRNLTLVRLRADGFDDR